MKKGIVSRGLPVFAGAGFARYNDNHPGLAEKITAARAGEETWKFESGGQIWTSPAHDSDVAYIGSGDSSPYSFGMSPINYNRRFFTGGRFSKYFAKSRYQFSEPVAEIQSPSARKVTHDAGR